MILDADLLAHEAQLCMVVMLVEKHLCELVYLFILIPQLMVDYEVRGVVFVRMAGDQIVAEQLHRLVEPTLCNLYVRIDNQGLSQEQGFLLIYVLLGLM